MSTTQSVDLPHGPSNVTVNVEPGSDYDQEIEIQGDHTFIFGITVDDHKRFTAHHACTRNENGAIVDDDLPTWVIELLAQHGIHEVED